MSNLKFSGHDTFHCRQQWLLKGVEFIDSQRYSGFQNLEEAILNLGVGKNMVQSIQYWLRAFGLINEERKLTDIAKIIFSANGGFDRYLEDEGTLWLLQYLVCTVDIASIYKLIFSDFTNERISNEFDERQIINFIKVKIAESSSRETSENTLSSDFKVFIQSYFSGVRTLKSIEDDFNSPLIELNLISSISRENGVITYKLNKENRSDFPLEIFGYCLFDLYENNSAIQFKDIRKTLGSYFVISNEGLEIIIENLCREYSEFIFNDDAGIRQIQIKADSEEFKINLLQKYYRRGL
ncbi:DUF4007 family protein [Flavobacterium aciduliphilum]|uniref:Uncharacterized protein DUF4007 n=1 Tax=Flavobacterium aciduliphilum TaxID=1101402 RepID=A0A328YK75_9FLAO|nr:DUF4007 family protein [Flavobacterium aciduliphilum]RAR73714.1 uncharacterized protein DUF4007 [Flavobacterium aciduliphilum]